MNPNATPATVVSPPQPNPGLRHRARRAGRRLLGLAAVLLLLYLFRASLLGALVGLLIAEDQPPHGASLVLLDGDRRHDRAAELWAQGGVRQVLLVEPVPERLVSLGLVPSRTAVDRRALGARGLPPEVVRVLPGQALDDWDAARILRAWLVGHPQDRLLVLCERFGSRRKRLILGRVLGEDSARVSLRALPHRDYDETNWWRLKDGLLDCFNSSLALLYAGLAGENSERRPAWDPDAYEHSLP